MDSHDFDALLCDLDGVIRFFDHRALNRLEEESGLPAGATLRTAFTPDREQALLLGRFTRDEWAASIAEGLTVEVGAGRAAELAAAFTRAPHTVDPEVVGMLGRLRGTVPVVLVTNATVWLDEDLARLGLDDLADAVVNSSRVGVAKPDSAIYTIAAERAGVPAGRCLFVDDSAVNVDAARAAGMSGLHYREVAQLRAALASRLAP